MTRTTLKGRPREVKAETGPGPRGIQNRHHPTVGEEAIFFQTPSELRAWLEEHHAEASELWVGQYKKASGRRSLTWSEVVDEALCFGWIDSKAQRIDEQRYRQRLTPRRRNSNWSAINVAKVAELRAQGRMTPAGEAAFAARRDDARNPES